MNIAILDFNRFPMLFTSEKDFMKHTGFGIFIYSSLSSITYSINIIAEGSVFLQSQDGFKMSSYKLAVFVLF